MKTNTGSSSRIREALRTIRGIAQEIVDAAADPSRKLSDLFTEAAIQRKVDACMGLALAVAACGRCKWLREVRREIEETAAVVIAADNALAPLMTLNPEAMSNAIVFELKVFEMLLAAGPQVLLLARIARLFRLYAISQLHKEFVGVRIQLQASERGGRSAGGRPGRGRQPAFTQKAVATLCGKDVNTVARWESGAIRPPLDYTADLRTKGGVGFFDWVREYNAHNGVADVFVQIQKGNVVYTEGLPDHGLMGALATVDGQSLCWHCTEFEDEHAPEATFESDGCEEPLEPGEYTAALTLNYAVDDGTGVSQLEPLVIENVKFTVGE